MKTCTMKRIKRHNPPFGGGDRELRRNASGYYDPTAYNAIKKILEEEKKEMEFKRGEIYEYALSNGSYKYALVVSADEKSTDSSVSIIVLNERQYGNYCVAVRAVDMMYAECDRISFAYAEKLDNYCRTATDEEMKAVDKALVKALRLDIEAQGESGEVEKLRLQLKTTEETADGMMQALRIENEKLKNFAESCEQKLAEMELAQKSVLRPPSEEVIRLRIECDFYKKQYEALFERMMTR